MENEEDENPDDMPEGNHVFVSLKLKMMIFGIEGYQAGKQEETKIMKQ